MIKSFEKTLSGSLSFNIVCTIFVINVSIIIAMFFFLKNEFASIDKHMTIIRFHEVSDLIALNGVGSLNSDKVKTSLTDYSELMIVVYNDQNQKIYEKMPSDLQHFEMSDIKNTIEKAKNNYGSYTIEPTTWLEETIEVYAQYSVPYKLIVGYNTDSSEDFANQFFKFSLILTFIAGAISVLLTYLFINRTLKPINVLIQTVKSIRQGHLKTIETPLEAKYELSELTKLFNDMILDIKKLIATLQGSIDAIAHDLRTPLTHISIRMESLLKDQRQQFNAETLGDLFEEVQTLSGLVNTLLEIAEADSKNIKLNIETFELLPLLNECAELYEYICEEKKATLKIICPPEITVIGDRNRLKRVISNLIDNALKYTTINPIITIEGLSKDNNTFIKIKDNGMGIDKSDIDKIWQRLYRADQSRQTSGMGLGLSFVKSIIEAHKWKIDVMSTPQKGTEFIIEINLSNNLGSSLNQPNNVLNEKNV